MMQDRQRKDTTLSGSLPPAGSGWPKSARALPTGGCPAEDELGREIAALKALHPRLQVRFRESNLKAMDEPTKLALLRDMRDALGIRPLAADRI